MRHAAPTAACCQADIRPLYRGPGRRWRLLLRERLHQLAAERGLIDVAEPAAPETLHEVLAGDGHLAVVRDGDGGALLGGVVRDRDARGAALLEVVFDEVAGAERGLELGDASLI